MTEYTLRFRPHAGGFEQEETFSAPSVGDALDIAKRRASGKEAELTVDGRLVCTLTLVEDTGVWLVKRASEIEGADSKSEN